MSNYRSKMFILFKMTSFYIKQVKCGFRYMNTFEVDIRICVKSRENSSVQGKFRRDSTKLQHEDGYNVPHSQSDYSYALLVGVVTR